MESFYKDQFRGAVHQRMERPSTRNKAVSDAGLIETDQFVFSPHGKSIIFSSPVVISTARPKRRWLVLLTSGLSSVATFFGTILLAVLDPASLALIYNVVAALVETLSV